VSFVRIGALAAVSLVMALAGCGHDSASESVVGSAAAAPAVPLESASEEPAVTGGSTAVEAPTATVSPKPARTASPSAAAASGSAGLDRFVAAVQRKLPDVALDRRDEEVEDLGEQACAALGHGRSATAVTDEVAAQGVTPADAKMLVGLARDNLCRA